MIRAWHCVVCQISIAAARGGAAAQAHPWNFESIDQLPVEVRNAINHLCGPPSRAAHYFVQLAGA
jgi:hypothetical protein